MNLEHQLITKYLARVTLVMALLVGSVSSAQAQQVYLYQMPDGSRLISGHPLLHTKGKLVRRSKDMKKMGHYAARRTLRAKRQMRLWSYLIYDQAKKHDIDESLVKAVIYTESYFNPHATSKKGASGLMQLMPATAEKYGVDDLYNPRQNIIAGIKHLKYLLTLYPDNLQFALAAYNAGENAVNKYNGIPPYRETQGYVKKVMHHFKRFQTASNAVY
ncbi:MAG: lytic transglycosylase domain-containing protein [Gammaproteobacteria bacterium]|nr:lytic transglycosylase domain-containing protein [Gammaproteobacteria bacterium]